MNSEYPPNLILLFDPLVETQNVIRKSNGRRFKIFSYMCSQALSRTFYGNSLGNQSTMYFSIITFVIVISMIMIDPFNKTSSAFPPKFWRHYSICLDYTGSRVLDKESNHGRYDALDTLYSSYLSMNEIGEFLSRKSWNCFQNKNYP